MRKIKKKKKKIFGIIFFTIILLFVVLFLIRLVSPTEIDDITPGIPCPELQKYNPDVLYVIPDYNNTPISENPEWCRYILSLNKTLELHGITHTYREFLYSDISQMDLAEGIIQFEKCFNQSPDMFKPPQLDINNRNRKLIKNNKLVLRTRFDQITHKVYHCSDSDVIPNRIVNLF